MKNHLTRALLFPCCLILAACVGSNTGTCERFEQSLKGYNKMLRWQEVSAAGATYMEPEGRQEFQDAAREFKERGVTITDYRLLTSECLAEKGSAEATLEFDYYILPSNRIKTVTYQQEWNLRQLGEDKSWRLSTGLPDFP